MDINSIMNALEVKHPGEKEYLQAVREVLLSVGDVYNKHPEFEKARIIERMFEPNRITTALVRIKAAYVFTHQSIYQYLNSSVSSRHLKTH